MIYMTDKSASYVMCWCFGQNEDQAAVASIINPYSHIGIIQSIDACLWFYIYSIPNYWFNYPVSK